jgi:hypothetical protein
MLQMIIGVATVTICLANRVERLACLIPGIPLLVTSIEKNSLLIWQARQSKNEEMKSNFAVSC